MAASKSIPRPEARVTAYGNTPAVHLLNPGLSDLRDARDALVLDLEQLLSAIATGSALDAACEGILAIERERGRSDEEAQRTLRELVPVDHRADGSGSGGALVDSAMRRLRELEDVVEALFALAESRATSIRTDVDVNAGGEA